MTPKRYAIYYAPPEGADWARFGTSWLGWDMLTGTKVAHPAVTGLPDDLAYLTETPRKYGLHGTIKPPFRLAQECTANDLFAACKALASTCAPVTLDGLDLTRLGRFLALCPDGDTTTLNALAARCVTELDQFRAPAEVDELARRRSARLSQSQDQNLINWGYPYVLESFRFHITLTGRLSDNALAQTEAALRNTLLPLLPRPFQITDLALAGEADDGRFHLLHRYALSG